MEEPETSPLPEVKTNSIETTLVPLVTQITTLVGSKETFPKSERALKVLNRVGQAVNLAIERFTTVGETIADENPEIRQQMCEACREARTAGYTIQKLTDLQKLTEPVINDEFNADTNFPAKLSRLAISPSERRSMVKAARQLLTSITRVLVLADSVVVKQIIQTKDMVSKCLTRLEGVTNFPDFIQGFSQFGNEMVKFAHLTGDRQNDLKSAKERAQMAVARVILERSTMMLLTASKCCLRHPECEPARRNRDSVFLQVHRALELVQQIVTSSDVSSSVMRKSDSADALLSNDSGICLSATQPTATRAIKDFLDLVASVRNQTGNTSTAVPPGESLSLSERLSSAFDR